MVEQAPGKIPPRYFYMVAVREALERGDREEIDQLISGAREVQSNFGDLDSLIRELEQASNRAR